MISRLWLSLLVVCVTLISCGKVINSSSGDYILDSASLNYVGAYAVMKEKCFSCHREFNTTQKGLISLGFVVPGNPLTSSMYNRLQGSEGAGTKNMPQTGSLTAEDRKIIKDWISGIQ